MSGVWFLILIVNFVGFKQKFVTGGGRVCLLTCVVFNSICELVGLS